MSNTPLSDAAKQIGEPSNSAGLGVKGTQADGVAAGGFVSKGFGKGRSLEAEGGISQRKGWGFSAFFRKVWK